MKKRIVTIHLKGGVYKFDMGVLRSSGAIPVHYDLELLKNDEGLVNSLIAKEMYLEKQLAKKKIAKTKSSS